MEKYIKLADVLETLKKANIGGYITDRLLEIPTIDINDDFVVNSEIIPESFSKDMQNVRNK